MARQVPPELARERETRAWAGIQQGKSQAVIASELGVTPAAVSKMLDRVEARVLKALEQSVTKHKARQHGRFEHIFSEAMAAWERSKTPRQKSRNKSVSTLKAGAENTAGLPSGVRTEKFTEAASTDGNFLFLQTAMQALGDINKLWGLNAPKKVDLLDTRRPLEKLTDEELEKRRTENAALLTAEDTQ